MQVVHHWKSASGDWRWLRWTFFFFCSVAKSAVLHCFYIVAMGCFLVSSLKRSLTPAILMKVDPCWRGKHVEKHDWVNFGLVLNSNWAGFVLQTWQPVSISILACFAKCVLYSVNADMVNKSELGIKNCGVKFSIYHVCHGWSVLQPGWF